MKKQEEQTFLNINIVKFLYRSREAPTAMNSGPDSFTEGWSPGPFDGPPARLGCCCCRAGPPLVLNWVVIAARPRLKDPDSGKAQRTHSSPPACRCHCCRTLGVWVANLFGSVAVMAHSIVTADAP